MKGEPGADGPSFFQRWRDEASLIAHEFGKLLSPASLWSGVKTLAWLGPLTVLIWIYAEQGQKIPRDGEIIPITVRSGDPKVYVELRLPNDETSITADLIGPAGQLDEVHRKLQNGDAAQAVQLTIPASLAAGERTLQVEQYLMANPIFANSSVQIVRCKPSIMTVFIDPIEERELAIRVPDTLKNVDGAVFEPPTIRVRAPSEVFKKATKLEAQLTEAANVGKSGDQDALVHVKLADVLPALTRAVSYDTEVVKAHFKVKENAEATYVYPSIPILTLGPPLVLSRYDVVFDQDKDTLANVEVVGPGDQIAAAEKAASPQGDGQPSVKPRAILEVTGDDIRYAGQSWRSRQLKFDRLPHPSIRVSSKDEKREVSFRIVERTASQ